LTNKKGLPGEWHNQRDNQQPYSVTAKLSIQNLAFKSFLQYKNAGRLIFCSFSLGLEPASEVSLGLDMLCLHFGHAKSMTDGAIIIIIL
jgi:hypothetical protein